MNGCRYWYLNGCLFPDMGTAFIAIDKCDEENGCLQVRYNKCSSILLEFEIISTGTKRLTSSW